MIILLYCVRISSGKSFCVTCSGCEKFRRVSYTTNEQIRLMLLIIAFAPAYRPTICSSVSGVIRDTSVWRNLDSNSASGNPFTSAFTVIQFVLASFHNAHEVGKTSLSLTLRCWSPLAQNFQREHCCRALMTAAKRSSHTATFKYADWSYTHVPVNNSLSSAVTQMLPADGRLAKAMFIASDRGCQMPPARADKLVSIAAADGS